MEKMKIGGGDSIIINTLLPQSIPTLVPQTVSTDHLDQPAAGQDQQQVGQNLNYSNQNIPNPPVKPLTPAQALPVILISTASNIVDTSTINQPTPPLVIPTSIHQEELRHLRSVYLATKQFIDDHMGREAQDNYYSGGKVDSNFYGGFIEQNGANASGQSMKLLDLNFTPIQNDHFLTNILLACFSKVAGFTEIPICGLGDCGVLTSDLVSGSIFQDDPFYSVPTHGLITKYGLGDPRHRDNQTSQLLEDKVQNTRNSVMEYSAQPSIHIILRPTHDHDLQHQSYAAHYNSFRLSSSAYSEPGDYESFELWSTNMKTKGRRNIPVYAHDVCWYLPMQ